MVQKVSAPAMDRMEPETLMRSLLIATPTVEVDAAKTYCSFCWPIVTSALSRAVEDPVEREALLMEGAEMLARGAVGHNHLWYHRDAIEAFLGARDPKGMMLHVERSRLTRVPSRSPRRHFSPARGRCLAAVAAGDSSEGLFEHLKRVRAELVSAGFKPFLAEVDDTLTARR